MCMDMHLHIQLYMSIVFVYCKTYICVKRMSLLIIILARAHVCRYYARISSASFWHRQLCHFITRALSYSLHGQEYVADWQEQNLLSEHFVFNELVGANSRMQACPNSFI